MKPISLPAVVFGLVAAGLAASAGAEPIRVFDPVTRSFVVYDLDAPQRQSRAAERRTLQAALPQNPPRVAPAISRHRKPGPEFDRQIVAFDTAEEPGTVIIDTAQKFLYYVQEDDRAVRYGVGVGREGFGWTGTVFVGSVQESPKWFPPPEMVARQPELAKYVANGMPGGDGNPLGVRALYLHDDTGKDTLYRIHGTIEPWSIGLNVSSGCIRMLNENVTELYSLVTIGTKVVVL